MSMHPPTAPRSPITASGRARRWCHSLHARWARDNGQVTALVVVLTTGILALAGLALDGGLALAAKVTATGHAEAAARAGAQAIDLSVYRDTGEVRLSPSDAVTEARSYLAAVGATGTVTVSGDTVTVSVTEVRPTQLLGLVGISTLRVQGAGSAHPQRGVVTLEP